MGMLFIVYQPAQASTVVDPAIDDNPLRESLSLPDWFKLTFLDIKDDLAEAHRGKRGLIIYFGQKYCPYCKAHLHNNWEQPDIVAYTRAHFDVIGIDVRGDRSVTDVDGKEYTEKHFAAHYKANFTPTILFFDRDSKLALRLTGYRPPYAFRAALEFVADRHYTHEDFRDYLARAEGAESYGQDTLNAEPFFGKPPYDLSQIKQTQAVFLERPRCHACDVLHANPLRHTEITDRLKRLHTTQLNMNDNTPVTLPDGTATTALKWAESLKLDYAPTIIFYDAQGKEIIRVDSVVGFLRLRNVLDYVMSGDYHKQPNYQLWREEKKLK